MSQSQDGFRRIVRTLRQEQLQAEDRGRMRLALEHIIALKDGYRGGDDEHSQGRKAGYQVAGEIAEEALRGLHQ